jgi:hypothetical protein
MWIHGRMLALMKNVMKIIIQESKFNLNGKVNRILREKNKVRKKLELTIQVRKKIDLLVTAI